MMCAACGRPATRAVCEPAGPWIPVCDFHDDPLAMGNVPIADYERVNSYVPKMFGGTYEPPPGAESVKEVCLGDSPTVQRLVSILEPQCCTLATNFKVVYWVDVLSALDAVAEPVKETTYMSIEHKSGCPAFGGHGIEECICGAAAPVSTSPLTPREGGIQKIRDLIEKFRDPNSAMFSDGPVGYIPASLLAPLVDALIAAAAPPPNLTAREDRRLLGATPDFLKQASLMTGCSWKCHSKYVEEGFKACCSSCQRVCTALEDAFESGRASTAAAPPPDLTAMEKLIDKYDVRPGSSNNRLIALIDELRAALRSAPSSHI